MRVEPHGIGSVMHVTKRGARGANIVHDEDDRKHFLRCLFFLNDTHQDPNTALIISGKAPMTRPDYWPDGEPLTEVLAWTLMSNHFHLILREVREGGIAKFMQRLGGSMSARSNAKLSESGSLFQGGYKARVVKDDADLRWLAAYVMVKNVFELHPGGFHNAAKLFEKAWRMACTYPYSSMSMYANETHSPIMPHENLLKLVVGDAAKFKRDARDMVKDFASREVAAYEWLMLEENKTRHAGKSDFPSRRTSV